MGTEKHCEPEKVTGEFPPFWGWVMEAKYDGTRKFHERTLDIWKYQVWLPRWLVCVREFEYLLPPPHWCTHEYPMQNGGISLEVGVAQDTPNQPVIFNRVDSHDQVGFSFQMFNATKPPASYFTVPAECQMWRARHVELQWPQFNFEFCILWH